MTSGAHKLVHSELFLDYQYEVWHLLSALGSDVRQKLYIDRCTSTVSALNYCGRIFFKSFSYLYEVVRTNFSADFSDFRNFWPHLAKIVAPPSDECENYVAFLKEKFLTKKSCKPRPNRPINGNAIRVRTMHPSNTRRSGLGAWPTKKHHIFAPTAGAHCTIFPKLCMLIELVVSIIKGVIHFSIQRIVFPTRSTEKFGLIYRRAVSPQ